MAVAYQIECRLVEEIPVMTIVFGNLQGLTAETTTRIYSG